MKTSLLCLGFIVLASALVGTVFYITGKRQDVSSKGTTCFYKITPRANENPVVALILNSPKSLKQDLCLMIDAADQNTFICRRSKSKITIDRSKREARFKDMTCLHISLFR